MRVAGATETDIPGATSSTYRLMAADAGKRVRVKVNFTDAAGNSETRTGDAYPSSGTVAGIQAVALLLDGTLTVGSAGSETTFGCSAHRKAP